MQYRTDGQVTHIAEFKQNYNRLSTSSQSYSDLEFFFRKCTKSNSEAELCLALGLIQCSPDPLAAFRGGLGGKGKWILRKGKERKENKGEAENVPECVIRMNGSTLLQPTDINSQ